MNLSKSCKITRVLNAVAAGTTDQDSTGVDMLGFDGVMFVAAFGTLTATQVTTVVAQGGSDNSSFATTIGTSDALADADSNKVIVLDCYNPSTRYVRLRVDRGTANAVIDGVWAVQYRGHKAPVTHSTTVASAKLVVG